MQPLVSVIIPTFERSDLLKRALDSVKAQSYTNLEVIIVDDSRDFKDKSFFDNYSFSINYKHRTTPRGAPSARNTGIELSHGKFIAFLDDDDTWYPDKIKLQVEQLHAHPWSPLCITYSHDKRFNHERINKPSRIISHKQLIKSFNLSSTSSYLVRASSLQKLKKLDGYYFDESLNSGQEYDLALRLTKNNDDVITLQKTLITQNSSPNQISENWYKKISGIIQLYQKHHKDYQPIDHIKTLGLLVLFTSAYIFGNRIYSIIIPIKEIYEE